MKGNDRIHLFSKTEIRLNFAFFFLFFMAPIYKYYQILEYVPELNLTIIRFLTFIPIFILFLLKLPANYKYFSPFILNLFLILYFGFLSLTIFSYFKYDFISLYIYDYLNNLNSIFVNYFMFFVFGIYLSDIYLRNKNGLMKNIKNIWLIFFIFCLSNISNLFIGYGGNLLGETDITYINMADNFAFISLLIIGLTNSDRNKVILILISIIILFFIPSRTTFIAFIAAILVYIIVVKSKFIRKNIIKISLAIILSFSIFQLLPSNIIKNNRIYRTEFVTLDDTSLEKRNIIFESNIKLINEYIFFGRFMGENEFHNESGYYIHNYLSLLQQYGIFLFSGFVLLYLTITKKIWQMFNNRKSNEFFSVIVLIFIFVSIEIIFARSYQNPLIWSLAGIFVLKK